MTQTTFIYCLTEPGTKTIRYFGKADDPQDRLKKHITGLKRYQHLYCARWVARLKRAREKPDLHILCEVPSDDFSRFEKAFITLGRLYGFPLTNASDGGDGNSGYRYSPEQRDARRIRFKGIKKTAAHRKNLSIARTGIKEEGASSKFIGVCYIPARPAKFRWRKPKCFWRATLYMGNKKTSTVGHFRSELEAAVAYDAAAKKFYGVKAKLNFPNG